jgi:hypothetical protein
MISLTNVFVWIECLAVVTQVLVAARPAPIRHWTSPPHRWSLLFLPFKSSLLQECPDAVGATAGDPCQEGPCGGTWAVRWYGDASSGGHCRCGMMLQFLQWPPWCPLHEINARHILKNVRLLYSCYIKLCIGSCLQPTNPMVVCPQTSRHVSTSSHAVRQLRRSFRRWSQLQHP